MDTATQHACTDLLLNQLPTTHEPLLYYDEDSSTYVRAETQEDNDEVQTLAVQLSKNQTVLVALPFYNVLQHFYIKDVTPFTKEQVLKQQWDQTFHLENFRASANKYDSEYYNTDYPHSVVVYRSLPFAGKIWL